MDAFCVQKSVLPGAVTAGASLRAFLMDTIVVTQRGSLFSYWWDAGRIMLKTQSARSRVWSHAGLIYMCMSQRLVVYNLKRVSTTWLASKYDRWRQPVMIHSYVSKATVCQIVSLLVNAPLMLVLTAPSHSEENNPGRRHTHTHT